MNPETPMTPREETEVRLTALLMGELPPDEAAALHAQMAADPALAALHARLRQAMELLRDATALPEQPAPPMPAQLSSERRERLLAHFKNPAPAPARVIVQPRRDWSWAVPLGLAAALIALLGGTVLLSGFSVRVQNRFVAEPPDFSSVDGMVAEAAPQSTHWSMQPGTIREFGEAEVRQQSAGGGGAAGEKSARFAFVPAPVALSAAPSSAPVNAPQTFAASTTTPVSKLYSASDMKQAEEPRLAAPSLAAITSAGGAIVFEALPSSGKSDALRDVVALSDAPAGSAGGERGLVQQADGLARNKAAKGIGSVTAGNVTLSGTVATNGKAELPALAMSDRAKAPQGVDQTLSFAKAKSAPVPVAEVAAGITAQGRPEADFDTDGSTKLADSRMKAGRETAEFEGFVNGGIAKSDFFAQTAPDGKRSAAGVIELDGATRYDFGTIEDKKKNAAVGGIAFWSDDESAKLNVNTAAEGTFWGAPEQTRLNRNAELNAPMEKAKAAPSEPAASGKPGSVAQESEVLARRLSLAASVDELKRAEPQLKAQLEDLVEEKVIAGKPVEVAKLEKGMKQLAAKDSDDKPAAQKPAEPAPEAQPEIATSANAFSTFSLNVSDVAFKLAAASLEQGKMPEPATVRSEEFINAFNYRDPEPAAGAPLACTTERARYPFAQNRDLLRCSVKTAAAGRQSGRALNIVLLLDNSGSMERADRVRILHEALRVLAAQLQPQDKLSVVTFARTPRLWADGVAGDKAGEVTARVGEITPQGGTDIAAALDLGYATALRHFQVGSINRVVLLTDGAANLGDVNPDALKQKVEAHRKQGVALDCFGIGWEGYDDTLLEALSRNGDGRYGFINTPEEAATGFAAQLAGALRVAASDVKVQVEWNPRRVTAYRQIGYAKHQLKKEQFRDNTVDAAEIGAAESGNALYVVEVNPRGEGDLATVRVRFKVPGTSDYREHEWTVPFTRDAPPLEQASPALRLAGAASAFSEWLTASPYASEVTPNRLLGLLNGVPAIYGADPRPQKLEWMIRTAKSVSGR